MTRLIDLTGKQFGRLLVLERAERGLSKSGDVYWRCRCKCGIEKTVNGVKLRSGNTKSCGCLNSDKTAERNQRRIVHGMHKTPTYSSWKSMVARCSNPNSSAWKYYGARGIKVCDEWLTFENFYADMGDRPPNKTLDRINNDKGYEPTNCRWASLTEQFYNRRIFFETSTLTGGKCVSFNR